MRHIHCPVCGFSRSRAILPAFDMPLATMGWPRSAAAAGTMPRLPHDFGQCLDCGHVFNRLFDESLVHYEHEPNLMYNGGSGWSRHLDTVCRLAAEATPPNGTVVEIGCGPGQFLERLQALRADVRTVGFDPFAPEKIESGGPEIHARYFDPLLDSVTFAPDLIVARHVLEHMESCREFIEGLLVAASQRSQPVSLLLEVPCIDVALASNRVVDFYFEHNSQFTTESFQRLMHLACEPGLRIHHGYGTEVIYGVGVIQRSRKQLVKRIEAADRRLANMRDNIASLRAEADRLAESGGTVVIWGGTGKAATLMHHAGMDRERFPLVVDSDRSKAGTHVPGTGQAIRHCTELSGTAIDTLVIPPQWRAADILSEVDELDIRYAQALVERDGLLIPFQPTKPPPVAFGTDLP